MSRALHIVLALCVAAQALAHDGSVLVCRYTGEALDPCACPQERRVEPDCPTSIRDQGCCELRKSDTPATPALVKATRPAPTKYVFLTWLYPEPSQTIIGGVQTVFVAARQQAPPSTPLYISIRSLLI